MVIKKLNYTFALAIRNTMTEDVSEEKREEKQIIDIYNNNQKSKEKLKRQ